jgi:hypothetical protein
MGQSLAVAPAPKLALPLVITVLVFWDEHGERGSYGEALNTVPADAFGVIR